MTGERTLASGPELVAMRRAAQLAWTVAGTTSPNPAVGAVILDRQGRTVGEGVTQPHGQNHAEVQALLDAGAAARGGTAVVTLEPCNHVGRTGPCTQALVAAGVRRVVYALDDPNPVARGGADYLAQAGLVVVSGAESALVTAGAIRPWVHAIAHNRPFVTWKFAATLDGRSAAADGTSQWISNEASRVDVHALRAIVDAIVVGSGTVLADDPQLTVRQAALSGGPFRLAGRQPLRAVLDRRHRVPMTARVFDDAAETIRLDTAVPRFALKALFDRGVRSVLLEGGPTVAGAFLQDHCVDEVVGYLAPTLLGSGTQVLADAGITTLADSIQLKISEVTRLGDDIKITARPVWPTSQES